ncbi:MAG TPA: hypothetical protein VD969_02245 [Symbiobacteriaceae bacterium]|nr:hypothetical protein [Symbiobacteriaceae bacterium]
MRFANASLTSLVVIVALWLLGLPLRKVLHLEAKPARAVERLMGERELMAARRVWLAPITFGKEPDGRLVIRKCEVIEHDFIY